METNKPGLSASDKKVVLVDESSLRYLDVRPTFKAYLNALWNRRFFIVADAKFRAFRTTRDYRWWKFWLIAQPILDAAMYGLLFGVLLQTSRGIDNFLGFLVIGITFFNSMSKIILAGSGLIRASKNMIQAFPFPRASLVLSLALRYFLDSLPPMIISIVFGLVMQWGTPLGFSLILSIPITLLLIAFATGVTFFVARITAFLPDLRAILDIFMRAWFFSSGVFYSIDRFATHEIVHKLMTANPVHVFLDSLRGCVLYGEYPGLNSWIAMILWASGTFVVGILFFWQAEEKYVLV